MSLLKVYLCLGSEKGTPGASLALVFISSMYHSPPR
jgi:hypothetical protein